MIVHRPRRRAPRAAWLAFLALAIQVLVPFFMAVEIARAEVPGGTAVICSALGHVTREGTGQPTDHGLADHCSICTTLAAAHAFTPPTAPPLPSPTALDHTVLAVAESAQAALLVASAYRPRGPPPIT